MVALLGQHVIDAVSLRCVPRTWIAHPRVRAGIVWPIRQQKQQRGFSFASVQLSARAALHQLTSACCSDLGEGQIQWPRIQGR